MLKGRWQSLEPKTKRLVLVGLVVGAGLVAIASVPGADTGPTRSTREETIRHVLTDRDTRSVGLEALSADLKAMRQEVHRFGREIERIDRDIKGREPKPTNEDLREELNLLKEDLELLRTLPPTVAPEPEPEETELVIDIGPDSNDSRWGSGGQGQDAQKPESFAQLDPLNPMAIFQGSSWPVGGQHTVAAAPVGPGQEAAPTPAAPSVIKRHVQEVVEDPIDEAALAEEEMLYLPAGSILTGTFLNGMDAPTGQGARKDPFPSTLRIQKEAILPNRFRADVRECFLIVSGYGDLSSERAYLRGETISCVREDGGVIEATLESYAVGEDGKAGVRGRLVSKQGQIIAKSLMAGFLSGVSKAFDVKPVPVIETTNTGSTSYSRNEPNTNWLQSSAVSGASSALDRIAQFYLEMAEGMFPVVEVDAGRQIDVIVSKGTNLQVRSKAPRDAGRGTSNRTQR